MKKLFTLAVVAATMMFAQPADAQIQFGVKGGVNLSSFSFSNDADMLDSKNRTGFFIGPTVNFTLPVVGLGVDASVLYDQREAKVKSTYKYSELNADMELYGDNTLKMQQVVVPINLRYGFGLGNMASAFVFAGPQFGFNVGDKETKIWKNIAEWDMKSSNFSLNFGVGVMLINHLQVTANYNLACGKTSELNFLNASKSVLEAAGIKSPNVKANTWQIGLAYYF